MQHSHSTLTFKPLILFPPILYLLLLHPHHRLMLLAVSFYLLLSLPLPNSLRVFQWNAGGLRARSTKRLHFISSHSVDLIYIQDSNLNLSSSFQIPGFSALRSDPTHSRSGIFSTDVADASGGVIIFVKQSLFSSELSTSSLSSLGPYSDYVKVNISPNDSCSLLFLNAYAPLFVLLRRIAEPISFLFPFFPPCRSGRGGIFRASASASTEKDPFHRFRFQLPLPLPHPCKQPTGPHEASNSPGDIVERLISHLKGTCRNLTTDNWYTSYTLAMSLLQDKITLVGTLKKNKREIPAEFLPNKQKPISSSMFGFQKHATLVSFTPKKNKSVVFAFHYAP